MNKLAEDWLHSVEEEERKNRHAMRRTNGMMSQEEMDRKVDNAITVVMCVLMAAVVALMVMMSMVSCRSTKSEVESTKVSVSADTLVAENRVDTSVVEYRVKYDSIVSQTKESFGTVAASQVKDSTYVGKWNTEWVHVHDSMDVKVDSVTGRISYYYWNTKESRYVTHDTIYKERTQADSAATNHSLIANSNRVSAERDSLAALVRQYESMLVSKNDSTADVSKTEAVVEKSSGWWEQIKNAFTMLGVMAVIMAGSIGVVWWYSKKK